jgi:hypothetical protein
MLDGKRKTALCLINSTVKYLCNEEIYTKCDPDFIKRMASSGMLHHVAPVRTDVSEELSASIVRVTRIGELGT